VNPNPVRVAASSSICAINAQLIHTGFGNRRRCRQPTGSPTNPSTAEASGDRSTYRGVGSWPARHPTSSSPVRSVTWSSARAWALRTAAASSCVAPRHLAAVGGRAPRPARRIGRGGTGVNATPGPRTAMDRSDRAPEVNARRTPWILRGMARLAPATSRSQQLRESVRSKGERKQFRSLGLLVCSQSRYRLFLVVRALLPGRGEVAVLRNLSTLLSATSFALPLLGARSRCRRSLAVGRRGPGATAGWRSLGWQHAGRGDRLRVGRGA
jgi:hypothetical protein